MALVALVAGLYRDLPPASRSGAPLLLFVVGALALSLVVVADTDLPHSAQSLRGLIHSLAAQTAFLCVSSAMLLASWRLRGAPHRRRLSIPALLLAIVSFCALWIYVLDRSLPRGLMQKSVIGLILLWLFGMSSALFFSRTQDDRRIARGEGADRSASA